MGVAGELNSFLPVVELRVVGLLYLARLLVGIPGQEAERLE
jgi:hypothetical protein